MNRALVSETIQNFRETAVAFSELSSSDIDYRFGAKEVVRILEGTPSVFISQEGSGEQRLNLVGLIKLTLLLWLMGFQLTIQEIVNSTGLIGLVF